MSDVKSWLEEKRSAYLYNVIARQETDKAKKKMFNELALSAEKQSEMWKHQIEQAGKQTPLYRPDFRTRFIGFLLRHFTIKQLRIILAAMKVRGMSVYDSILINNHMLTHGAKYEKKHKGLNAAGNLRAAVFGVNDGLVSNASLLLGLVGGGANSHTLVLTGIAGLLAGACSMAAGEYVSMLSQREFFEYQIALEKEELALYPQEEAAELAVIYEARGLDKSEAQKLANSMISDSDKALQTLAREELGLNPEDLGSPSGAAIASFISFAFGAVIPLLPFCAGNSPMHLFCSLTLTGCSLFFIGIMLSLFTNRNAIMSGLRMLAVGAIAGSLTYLIGKIIGVSFT